MPVLFWILDTSCTNAYKLLEKLDDTWKGKHKQFVLELAWSLVTEVVVIDTQVTRRSEDKTESSKGAVVGTKASGSAEAGGYVKAHAREGFI